MITVRIVRRENRRINKELLDRHHVLRNDIFVGELGWRDMRSHEGREIDQFDTGTTVYFLIVEDDELIGGVRLHPTTGPTLMNQVYPGLASIRGLPSTPSCWELTRGWVVRSRREERPCRASGAWKAAVLEYALELGIETLSSVAETWFMPRIMALRWRPRFLGLPATIDGFELVAFRAEVSVEALEATRAYYGFDAPVAVWDGIQPRDAGDRDGIHRRRSGERG